LYGLDLFSGVGGITKALEDYVQPVTYCENDRYAQAVLLSRMQCMELPTAPIWDDIRTLHAEMLPRTVDIIYGGFPCQDISIAGRGAGLAGERSGLFFEVARLVGEIRPRFVFLENVAAIRSRGGAEVVGELAGLWYDCRWDVLSAYDVGAPHLRERWWLLAHDASKDEVHASCANADGLRPYRAEIDEHGEIKLRDKQDCQLGPLGADVADANGEKCTQLPSRTQTKHSVTGSPGWWAVEPNVGRVAHGIPSRVDRLRGLGNAVVPAQAREAFKRLMGFQPSPPKGPREG